MQKITAADVKMLHDKTGYRIIECKKALEVSKSIDEAILYLKANGSAPSSISKIYPELDLMNTKHLSDDWTDGDCKILYEKYDGSCQIDCIFVNNTTNIRGTSFKIDLNKRRMEASIPYDGRVYSIVHDFRKSTITFEEDRLNGIIKIDSLGTVIIEDNVNYNIAIMLMKYSNYMFENGLYEQKNLFEGMIPIEEVECYNAHSIFKEYFEGTVIKQCELARADVKQLDSYNEEEVDSNHSNIILCFLCGNYKNKIFASYDDICSNNKELQFELDVVGCVNYSLSVGDGVGLKVLVDDGNMKILISNDPDYYDGIMIEFYQREEYETALAYLWIVIHKEEKNDAELLCTSKVNITDIKSTNPIKDINSTDDELDQLIGMNALKADVRNLVNFVKMQQTRKEKGLRTVPVSLHLVFTGNPGTGKTTVARILAKIYKQLGILSKGQLVEVDRSGLVAGYVGQTAIKTQEKIDEAKGGILFIDEAYTLVKDGNDYGQEAIDTILKAMEDNREDFIVIVAGYPDLMANFINSNPGLKSRFNKYFYFDDYSCDELEQIFNLMCQKYDYKLETSAEKAVREHIREMVANKDANFANARDIRNYFESIISNQASRVMLAADYDGDNMITITVQDVIL
jgi:SpoVK/Ycf46/Vps4 family AAA+-type ATPase